MAVVTLTTGEKLKLLKIRLVEEPGMVEVTKLRSQAAKVLGNSGLGVGVFGSPSFGLVAEAAALGLLSGVIAAAAQKTAIQFLRKAEMAFAAQREAAKMFDIGDVKNTSLPNPSAWFAISGTKQQEVDLSTMESAERKAFVEKHSLVDYWGGPPVVPVNLPLRFIHDGDEFVHVETDQGLLDLRWSQVATYACSQNL